MKVDSKELARKIILIAIAQSITACHVDPKHYERLTDKDRAELARLLNYGEEE